MSEQIGNIGEEEYKKAVEYFKMYWNFFKQKNPNVDDDKWLDIYFMVFISGFSAGISFSDKRKKTLMEEIIQSN